MVSFDKNFAVVGFLGEGESVFYLAASQRQIKRTSLRPLRLCGEDFRAKRLREERIGI